MTTSNDTTWKDIPGFEGKYQVSIDGQVRSISAGKNGRKPGIINGKNSKGYRRVTLVKNGAPSYCCIHRLVMLAFVGECPKGIQVTIKTVSRLIIG